MYVYLELLSIYYSFDCLVFLLVVAFKVYDVDRDGYISNGELFLVLKMMVGNNLKVRIFLFRQSCIWLYIAMHVFNTTNTLSLFLFRINNSNK